MSYGELAHDIGPDYKDKEIGYESGDKEALPKIYQDFFGMNLDDLNKLMEKENGQDTL